MRSIGYFCDKILINDILDHEKTVIFINVVIDADRLESLQILHFVCSPVRKKFFLSEPEGVFQIFRELIFVLKLYWINIAFKIGKISNKFLTIMSSLNSTPTNGFSNFKYSFSLYAFSSSTRVNFMCENALISSLTRFTIAFSSELFRGEYAITLLNSTDELSSSRL